MRKKRNLYGSLMLQLILVSLFTNCQLEQQNCDSLKKGNFYFYPSGSGLKYKIIRQDSIQTEIRLNTGDTSCWKVQWIENCRFTIKFLYGSNPEVTKSLSNSHIIVMQILEIKKNYYVFRASRDSITSTFHITDTLWMNSR